MDGKPLSHRIVPLLGTVLVSGLVLLSNCGVQGQPSVFPYQPGMRTPETREPPMAEAFQLPPRADSNPQAAPPVTPLAAPQDPPIQASEPTDPPPPEVTLKVRVAAAAAKDRALVYRLLVENRSATARAHHVIIRDALPDNVQYVSALPKPALEPAVDKPLVKAEVRWELGTLAPLERKELTLTLRPTGGDVRNTARIQFEFGQTVLTHLGRSDLGLKVSGPTQMAVRDKKDFIATVTNMGQVVATDVSLKAILPAGVQFSLSEPPEGTDKLSWKLGDLEPGASRRIRLELLAEKEGEGVVSLEATDGGGVTKPASANIVVGQARLDLHLKGPATRFLGSPVTYQLTVNNIGTMPATGVVVDYPVPPECQVLSATAPGGTVGDRVRWTIGTLAVGERRNVSLTLKLKNTTEAVNLQSSAEATADRGLNVQAERVITLFEGGTGLAFQVEQTAQQLEIDTDNRYIIKVRNQGTAQATGVALVVRLPAQLKFVSTGGVADAKENAGIITFVPQPIDPGKEVRFEVTARALRPGEARVRIELQANKTALVTGEESTHVIGDPAPPVPSTPGGTKPANGTPGPMAPIPPAH